MTPNWEGCATVVDEIAVVGSMAAPPSKLHFNEQEAGALLKPISASLLVLELRAERYRHVATLSDADAQAVAEAHAALATARATIQRLAQMGVGEEGGTQP